LNLRRIWRAIVNWTGWPFVDSDGLTGLGFTVAMLALLGAVTGIVWGAWLIWGNHNSCNPPNHLVYAYTSTTYVKGIPIPVNEYYCEA
jgi:hypothetical protein